MFKNKIFLHIVRKQCVSTEESENRKKRRVLASCEAKREPKKAVLIYKKTRPKKDNGEMPAEMRSKDRRRGLFFLMGERNRYPQIPDSFIFWALLKIRSQWENLLASVFFRMENIAY